MKIISNTSEPPKKLVGMYNERTSTLVMRTTGSLNVYELGKIVKYCKKEI